MSLLRSTAPLVLPVLFGACAAASPAPAAQPEAVASGIPTGDGQQTVTLGGQAITVFTFKPEGCAPTGILLVFHGVDRNTIGYRNAARPLAQRFCMVVAEPLFDNKRFSGWSYQHGGVVHRGATQPQASWTVNDAAELVAWVRAAENRPGLPFAELGHSAGAQYLSRVAAYTPDAATRIVIANPSTWVRPSVSVAAPYGFGGLFPPAQAADALRRYLAEPITVLLGREDHGSKDLATGEEAEEQGVDRYDRGQTVFREAQAAAVAHGWPFNWQLAVVPGVGHNARGMFGSDEAFAALAPAR